MKSTRGPQSMTAASSLENLVCCLEIAASASASAPSIHSSGGMPPRLEDVCQEMQRMAGRVLEIKASF